jgi:predicted O-methyltransferase YrrM
MIDEVWRRLPSRVRDRMRDKIVRRVAGMEFLRRRIKRPAIDGFLTLTPETPPAISACLERALATGVQGDYYEFGMYRGYSFWWAQKSANALGLKQLRFFGFDSFRGLPKPEGIDATSPEFNERDYAAALEDVKWYLEKYGIDWSRSFLIEGYYDDSLHDGLKSEFAMMPVMVALIDCDLYSSTVDVLEFLSDLLQPGSILMFDDWNCFEKSDDMGERRAFREFLTAHPGWRADPFVSFGWHGQSFVLSRVDSKCATIHEQTTQRQVQPEPAKPA